MKHIVANQVHDHHVFGLLFGRSLQGLGLRRIAFRVVAPGRCAFHGTAKQTRAIPVKKQLWRDREHLLTAHIQISRITAWLSTAQSVEIVP